MMKYVLMLAKPVIQVFFPFFFLPIISGLNLVGMSHLVQVCLLYFFFFWHMESILSDIYQEG